MNYPVSITDIAVIGMTCRFPKAKSPREYFENILEGNSCIEFFDPESGNNLGIYEKGLPANYVPAAGVIEDIEYFDAEFFGLTPAEASLMDPQHRVLLECAWEALEASGYIGKTGGSTIGVYASCSRNTYLLSNILQNPKVCASAGMYPLMIGNGNDFIGTRIAYKLGLTGPAITLQTACSSSLVAVHYACQDLILQNCDISLVGASTIHTPNKTGYNYEESGILSRYGACHPFDKDASGTVPGNGAGVLVLKRLQEAINDKDTIYAVIKGTRVNNDGNQKIGYTAPGISGQEKVIRDCFRAANIKPEQVGLVEAHGTGTKVGDPIEMNALKKAFNTTHTAYCAISSVKSQIGHLDATAGLAGLMKTVLCLDAKMIPPAPYLKEVNPAIDLKASPFYFPTVKKEWLAQPGQWRIAGVSSFGVGGTNSHALVMEAPPVVREKKKRTPQLFPFSAKNEAALNDLLRAYIDWFEKNPDADLQDVAYTLWMGRQHFRECRTFVTGQEPAALVRQLSERLRGRDQEKEKPVYIDFGAYSAGEIADKGTYLAGLYPAFAGALETVAQETGLNGGELLAGAYGKDLVSVAVLSAFCRFLSGMGISARIADNGRLAHLLHDNAQDAAVTAALQRLTGVLAKSVVRREAIFFGSENIILVSPEKAFPGTGNNIAFIDFFSADSTTDALLSLIGSRWAAGTATPGKHLFAAKHCGFVPLPTYAFQRKKYWIEAAPQEAANIQAPAVAVAGRSLDAIQDMWKEILGVAAVQPEDDFFALGGDSLLAIQFISRIKEAYGVVLNMNELMECTSATEVDALLQSRMQKKTAGPSLRLFSDQPLQKLRKGDNGIPLILFHPAGGTVYCYHELLRQMNIQSDVYGIQFPLEMLQEDVKKVPALAKHYMDLVKRLVPSGAYYLGGYSLGGNIAFEMATLFQQENSAEIKGLYLIDSHAPAAYKGVISNSNDLVACFPYVLSAFLNLPCTAAENIHDLPTMYRQLKAASIINDQIAYEDFELLFNVWRYNHLSLRDYDHAARYNGNVVVFRAEEEESEAFLNRLCIRRVEKTEWLQYINGNLEIIDVPGNHMSMLSSPHVQKLAMEFNQCYGHIHRIEYSLRA